MAKILCFSILALIVFILIILTIVVNIELDAFLSPFSFAWKKNEELESKKRESNPKQEAHSPQEKIIREKAIQWMENTPFTDEYLTAKDKIKLHARLYKNAESHLWAVCIHGWKGNIQNTACYGMNYFERLHCNVLLPENRCTGETGGRHIGMGWLDKDDICLWLNKIVSLDSEAKIVIHGESMGGATVMMTTGNNPPPALKCAVSDCGYTSVWEQFAHIHKNGMHLPTFPGMYIANCIAPLKVGYSLRQASSVNQLKKCKVPICFAHGTEDDFVPCKMVYKNYEAVQNVPKEIFLFKNAKHCESEFADSELYWKNILGFVKKYLS